jgi:CRISPR/Cas system endoribonuclease Cas6 (RAMP superfamily)
MAARQTKQHNIEKAIEKALREVTAAERTAICKYLARRAADRSVRFKVSKNGSDAQIELDHQLVMEAFASADEDFVNGIVSQLANASERGISELNFMLSIIKEAPRTIAGFGDSALAERTSAGLVPR